MEPVRLPNGIAPVTASDRLKRAKPREDSGGGSAFARYLRQNKGDPADEPPAAPEEPVDPEQPAEPGGHPCKKLIDIRV